MLDNMTKIITKLPSERKKKAETLLISLGKSNLQTTIIQPFKKKEWIVITDKHEYKKKNNVLPVYPGSMPKIFAETAPDLIKAFSNENLVVVDPGCGSSILGLSFAKDKRVKLAYEIDINPRALKMTKLNFLILGVEHKLKLIKKSYFEMSKIGELKNNVDIFISNPPFNPEVSGLPWAIHSGGGDVAGTLHFKKQVNQLDKLLNKRGLALFYMLSPVYDQVGNRPFLIDIFKNMKNKGKLEDKEIFLIRLQKEGYSLEKYKKELEEVHKRKKCLPVAMKLIKRLNALGVKGFNRYAILILNSKDQDKNKKLKTFLESIAYYENGIRKNIKCNYKIKDYDQNIKLLIPKKQGKEIDITTPFPKKETFKILYTYWSYTT